MGRVRNYKLGIKMKTVFNPQNNEQTQTDVLLAENAWVEHKWVYGPVFYGLFSADSNVHQP